MAAKNSNQRIRARTDQPLTFLKPFIPHGRPKVFYSRETGLPSFIHTERDNSAGRTTATLDIPAACYDYLEELKPLLQIKRTEVDFSIRQIKSSTSGKTRLRLDQHYKNIPVYGADVVIHLNGNGQGESFNGTYFNIEEDINVVPGIAEQVAIDKVNAQMALSGPLHILSEKERNLVQYAQPKTTLCIYEDKSLVKTFVLAYHVVSTPSIQQRWEYFIDANTGKVLHKFDGICFIDGPKTASATDLNGTTQTIDTYQLGATYFMLDASRPMFNAASSTLPDAPIGGIITVDMSNTFGDNEVFKYVTSTTNAWSSATTVSAHFNAGVAYEYFRVKHIRNSIDDTGGTIYSIINVADRETGALLDNAYWNGKVMFYGNGNLEFKPLAGSLDVAGHEMTHGVVQNSANLEYQGESGAINESMADIFGSMMDPADWLIGEDIVKLSAYPSGALRSMSDPHNGGTSLADPGFQPKHTSDKFNGAGVNQGVHINCGFRNYAFF
ncbi:MAG: M4 family metallopeptidase [Cyclobacteriaceae bacterium]